MDRIEIIHLRSHSYQTKADAVEAFKEIGISEGIKPPQRITLFQNRPIDTDISIFIFFDTKPEGHGKSPLGLALADAFSKFGQISHSVWENEISLPPSEQGD